jgi:hypothetical protein
MITEQQINDLLNKKRSLLMLVPTHAYDQKHYKILRLFNLNLAEAILIQELTSKIFGTSLKKTILIFIELRQSLR